MKFKFMQTGFILMSILLAVGYCAADGVFIPDARKKIPDIPVQRALVKYRDGIETLIIESSMSGEKGNYGWIIPLPNQPQKFDKVSPGLLKTLSLQLQPKLNHAEPHTNVFGVRFSAIITIIIVITCFAVMRWGAKGSIFPLAAFFLALYLLPNFVEYRSGGGSVPIANPLVEIKSREVVGNYEIFVLKAQNSTELNLWLADNNFRQFPPEATKLIDDYISQSWLFMVSKLYTISDGLATLHPLLLEFETDHPVYPMKLTALPGSAVNLELFVIADSEAVPVNYNTKKEYCNFFDFKKIDHARESDTSVGRKAFIPREWFGPFREIAHSDASKVMWDGCVVTKMTGKISSSAMTSDMFFEFKKTNPGQSELYSSRGKLDLAYFATLTAAIIGSIFMTIYYHSIEKRWKKPSFKSIFLALVIVSAAVFIFTYEIVGEKTEVYTLERNWLYNFQSSVADILSIPENNFSTGEELIEILRREGVDNPITHEPITLEESPGNITFAGSGKDIKLYICLSNGSLDALY